MWGKAVVETPHIDRLAKEGALCTRFYATTPVCSPSRSAFVSGLYPQNTPVTTNNIPMNDSVVTFAEVLRRQGYATGYAGKWHLDGSGKPQWGPKRQFGFADNRYMFNRGHWKQLEDTQNGPRVKARKGNKPTYDVGGADEESFTTDFLADKTVDFIRENKGKPFCYMVSIPDPHGPDTVRPPYNKMFSNQTYSKPRTYGPNKNRPSWSQPEGKKKCGYQQSSYYGMVRCIDDNVGKILKALTDTGLLDKTIVVFTSDHGDLRGEHHRQNKGVPLEASAKIPFVVRWPARIKAGTRVHEALGCVDFLPTVLSLMGVKHNVAAEGRDASDLLTSGRAPDGWDDVAIIRSTENSRGAGCKWIAAITKRYKLVATHQDELWLCDLEKDPDELTNFAEKPECKQVVAQLSKALIEYGQRCKDPYVQVIKNKLRV